MRGYLERLKDSFDESVYSGLLTLLFVYFFSVAGFYLFSDLDPGRWGTLGGSALSVFYLMTLQSVEATVAAVISHSPFHMIYFALVYFIFLSLLISTICAAVTQALRIERHE